MGYRRKLMPIALKIRRINEKSSKTPSEQVTFKVPHSPRLDGEVSAPARGRSAFGPISPDDSKKPALTAGSAQLRKEGLNERGALLGEHAAHDLQPD
jgi:hypothetical protein